MSQYEVKDQTPATSSESTVPNLNLPGESIDNLWYDVSSQDSSKTRARRKLESGDSSETSSTLENSSKEDKLEVYENKISFLKKIAKQIEDENLLLSRSVAQCDSKLPCKNGKDKFNMHELADELKSLKIRLEELSATKGNLKKNNEMLISNKLSSYSSLSMNPSGDSPDFSFNTELINFQKRIEKEINAFKEQLSQRHVKEVESLNQSHSGRLKNIEVRFSCLLSQKENEYSNQISKIKAFHEKKLEEITEEFKLVVKAKNEEIQKLQAVVENHAIQSTIYSANQKFGLQTHETALKQCKTETSSEKNKKTKQITFLQHCINNLEELFKKSEKIYGNQINKLKQEIGTRDKSLMLHMIAQKAEIINNTSISKQKEMDDMVAQLENRYRRLLENQQKYFVLEREQDVMLIGQLKSFIAQNCKACCTYCQDIEL